MKFENRQQELVYAVADYLSGWLEDTSQLMSIKENISCIESYGIKFLEPCDRLVVNSLRHLKGEINPWNDDAMMDVLVDCGFTKDEIDRYYP